MKKFIITIMMIAITVTTIRTTAFASGTNTDSVLFIDIDANSYYYDAVVYLFNEGIIEGTDKYTFSPSKDITYAEAMAIICRTLGVDTQPYETSGSWYSGYANYFWEVLKIGVDDYNTSITRGELCVFIVDAFDFSNKYPSISLKESDFTIFSDTNNYVTAILYHLGILKGISDTDGNIIFGGDYLLTRAQACTFIYRVIQTFTDTNEEIIYTSDYYTVDDSGLTNINSDILDYSYYDNMELNTRPQTSDDLINSIGYMMYHDIPVFTFTINIDTMDEEKVSTINSHIIEDVKIASAKFVEWSAYVDLWGMKIAAEKCDDDSIDLRYTLSMEYDERYVGYNELSIEKQKEYFRHKCAENVIKLYNDRIIKTGMTDKEIAEEIFKFIDCYLEYDFSYTNYTGYLALINEKATCEGYVSIYNYMCKLCGVEMLSVTGTATSDYGSGEHAWSKYHSLEDDIVYYIDVTWGDPVPDEKDYYDLKWFWVDNELERHTMNDYCYNY